MHFLASCLGTMMMMIQTELGKEEMVQHMVHLVWMQGCTSALMLLGCKFPTSVLVRRSNLH